MPLAKIILVLGPSGVGKSCVAKELENQHSFMHIDIDQNHPFQANGFPAEWDNDIRNVDFVQLASIISDRLANEGRSAAVVSFPTVHVFSVQQIQSATSVGISAVVLWGTEANCIEARSKRAKTNRVRFDLERYKRKNQPTFETYAQSDYAPYRIETFQPDGSRAPIERIVAAIIARASV